MINWQTGQNFTTVGGMGIHHPTYTLRKEGVTIIALSNKFTRKNDVRKLAMLFETIPSN
jgi:hypothetical protein